ncbi:MAG TPA: HAMP domain-containing sensor histidine kinase [Longimicrobium sp.]|nr:HAMP domain-containing sensor histidine kinase [Longimicrobium sp.]
MPPSSPTRRRLVLPRLHAGRRAPLLLLALSLAVTLGAIVQAQQAARSHRATAERLLGKYGSFAAWSYRQHTVDLLGKAFHAALDPAIAAADRQGALPSPAAVAEYARANAPGTECNPIYGAPYYFRVPLDSGALELAGVDPGAGVRAWIADTVRAAARAPRTPGQPFGVVSATVGRVPRHLVYTVLPAPDGTRWAYGYELEPARYRPLFHHVISEESLLPTTALEGRKGIDILSVQVVSPGVDVLFRSGSESGWGFAGEDSLGAGFGGLVVRAAVRPEAAGMLIIGGLPRSRLPLLLGMLALSVMLAAVAVGQLRREAELARMRSDFVSSVSHELRTPLAQVRLFLETLRLGRWKTEQQREWLLENVDRETTRLTNLVDNVLHFSRSERGVRGGEMEVVELAEYLDGVVQSFAPLAAVRRVRFETAAEPGFVARMDPEAFRQVLLNLLDNAVKYGPQGQTVRVTAAPAGEGRVAIAVEDEGPGIDPAEREQVWEPFRRGDRTVGSAAAGSGIGLSVVREIVAWHGGEARVEDGARGARIVVTLPGWTLRAEPAAPADAHPAKVAAA